MALSIKTNKMLWGRAASRCSLPECRRELILDPIDTDDSWLVGEAAHIVAESQDSPRGISDLSLEQRNTYSNLILLCNVHHKQIDDQVNHFTVERLVSIKAGHESWVRSSLTTFNSDKQAQDERWAGYVEQWASRSYLDKWDSETSFLMGATPAIRGEFLGKLDELQLWLLSRVWPNSSTQIRNSLETFRRIVNDLVCEFRKHAEDEFCGKLLFTKQFYKISEWDQDRYRKLQKQFDFHVDLIHDLTFEMTRAANLVCDAVREELDKAFRIEEGVLLVYRSSGLTSYTYRSEYTEAERVENPYPGLQRFMDIRVTRKHFIGSGQPPLSEYSLEQT